MAEQRASSDLISFGRWALCDVTDLTPDALNPRRHSRAQIRAIAKSIKALGFNAPVLIDGKAHIICGHGRYQAALLLGLTQIPVVRLEHLSGAQARAYAIADNRLADQSGWNDKALARHLKDLTALALDFDIEVTGFQRPKIEVRIQSLDVTPVDGADQFAFAAAPFVSRPGDLWILGPHRLYCASALDLVAYDTVLANEKAAAVFTDPPCNTPIDRLMPDEGKVANSELPITADVLVGPQLTDILSRVPGNLGVNCRDGALLYIGIDWQHMGEWLTAARSAGLQPLDLCVWAKPNGGIGRLYRARHELVVVLKNGGAFDLKSVRSGPPGPNRSNVWNYQGVRDVSRAKGDRRRCNPSSTGKPIALVGDAILDCTARGDIVLDPFVGSGGTILAAERTGRCCYGIEQDPRSVDTAIGRWQRFAGRAARDGRGRTFDEIAIERGGRP
jgi:DNA modification methylase